MKVGPLQVHFYKYLTITYVQISDLKWIAVWCIKFKVLFGQLNFPKSEAGTDLEAETESENRKGKVDFR